MDSNKEHLFKDQLDGIANNTSISVNYFDTRNDLHQAIENLINAYKNNGHYFIAGPKSFTESISSYIQNKDIHKKNIKKDAFFGYQ